MLFQQSGFFVIEVPELGCHVVKGKDTNKLYPIFITKEDSNMAQYHKRHSRFRSAMTPVVASPSQHHPRTAGKLQSVSQSVSQSIEPHSPNRLPSDSLVAGFSLRKYTGWMAGLLFVFFLTIFLNTVAIGAQTVPSPLMGEGKGGGGPEPAKVQMQETYGKLPLYFIQNDGQVDEKVKFYEKGSGHATYFTKEGVYISLINHKEVAGSSKQVGGDKGVVAQFIGHPDSGQPDIPATLVGVELPGQVGGDKDGQNISSELVKLTFLNANPKPEIIAVEQQEGKINYFIGKDPKKWRTNVPTYQAVIYKEVYPGIDIKFYGNNRQMEYDIIVKPGADPSKVQLAYDGIESLRVTENGDLEISLHSPSSTLTQKRPITYQEIDGKRIVVEGRFKVLGNHYTFELASYDTAHSLVIDPVLVYATYLGGSGLDYGCGIAVD